MKRARLLQLLREKSLQYGQFRLTSGKESHYYLDSKPTTLDPEGAYLSAYLLLALLKEQGIEADAVGGPALGAVPIVSSLCAVSFAERGRFQTLPAFLVRKEAKSHGTGHLLEGYQPTAGERVVIIDDICTTGGSTLRAIENAEAAGCKVSAVLCLVDREEGCAEALNGYSFHPLFTISELLSESDRATFGDS